MVMCCEWVVEMPSGDCEGDLEHLEHGVRLSGVGGNYCPPRHDRVTGLRRRKRSIVTSVFPASRDAECTHAVTRKRRGLLQ